MMKATAPAAPRMGRPSERALLPASFDSSGVVMLVPTLPVTDGVSVAALPEASAVVVDEAGLPLPLPLFELVP